MHKWIISMLVFGLASTAYAQDSEPVIKYQERTEIDFESVDVNGEAREARGYPDNRAYHCCIQSSHQVALRLQRRDVSICKRHQVIPNTPFSSISGNHV